MVKVQKVFAYTYKEKKHYRNMITIPEEVLKELNWKSDMDLEPVVRGDKLILQKKRQ